MSIEPVWLPVKLSIAAETADAAMIDGLLETNDESVEEKINYVSMDMKY